MKLGLMGLIFRGQGIYFQGVKLKIEKEKYLKTRYFNQCQTRSDKGMKQNKYFDISVILTRGQMCFLQVGY